MIKKFVLASLLVVLGLSISESFAQEDDSVNIFVKYNNEDPADFHEMKFVIYQDFDTTPFLETNPESNPVQILLPKDHRYQIDVFVNSMYAGVGYVTLDNTDNKLDISIPLSGGLQINVFYNDGQTPIDDATVVIRSNDGAEWRRSQTNDNGDTPRFWIQSTTNTSDYYIADIYLGETLIQKFSSIKLQPGLSYDQKIVTDVPKIVEELITITLYKNPQEKLTRDDGDYTVSLIDKSGKTVASSNVNVRGDAQFSSLKSGEYVVKITSKQATDLDLWPDKTILLFGQQNQLNIFRDQPVINTENDSIVEIESCNCASFRFDDVQDFWLTDVQIAVMKQFVDSNTPLTVGIIADAIGLDKKMTEFLSEQINSDKLEIATHGIGNKPFTEFTKEEQKQRLEQSIKLISENFGVTPTVFIPPQNRINQDTIDVLTDSSITHLSGSILHGDTPPFYLKNQVLYRFPEISTTGEYDPNENVVKGVDGKTTLEKAIQGLDNYGFAVITMHPQEFSTLENGVYTNVVNQKQINELNFVITSLKDQGIEIVPISEINLDSNVKIPSWIKNNASWWAEGQIDDNTFVLGIQYLVREGIIVVQETGKSSEFSSLVPGWIKNNAGWWANGQISDGEFVKGIEYLISNGIIVY